MLSCFLLPFQLKGILFENFSKEAILKRKMEKERWPAWQVAGRGPMEDNSGGDFRLISGELLPLPVPFLLPHSPSASWKKCIKNIAAYLCSEIFRKWSSLSSLCPQVYFVTTYSLEICVESPNYTESIYFWRIQAGGENDTSLLIGKSFEKLLRFLAFDGVCMRTDCPKKETSGTCLYASMSFKHLVQRHFDDCLLGSNSCKGKTHFQEKTMVLWELTCWT